MPPRGGLSVFQQPVRHVGLKALWLGLLVLWAVGCKKEDAKKAEPPAPPASEASKPKTTEAAVVARIHWLGKKRLAAESNAAWFMSLWNLPESARLEAQTLKKLSTAPWRLILNQNSGTNAEAPAGESRLLRPLLEDVVQEESYLELRQVSNGLGALALAVRLPAARAAVWDTNLAATFVSLGGAKPVGNKSGGWSIKTQRPWSLAEFARIGDWVVVGLAPEQESMVADFGARIQRDNAPFARPATNVWVDMMVDTRRAVQTLFPGFQLLESLPQATVRVWGDGTNVISHGDLEFAKPLAGTLEPWNIPTNLVTEPLVSFAAWRGIRPMIESSKSWRELELGAAPDQLYTWALGSTPLQTFAAAPVGDGSNYIYQLSRRVVNRGNDWLSRNAMGKFDLATNRNGVEWLTIPFIVPFLQSSGDGQFAYAGFFPAANANPPPPSELLAEVVGTTNLVWYDWEITGARIQGWIDVGQLLRITFRKPQLPADSVAMGWLKSMETNLVNCITIAKREETGSISVRRKGTIGLTAMELHIMADWLESPRFPEGFHTLLATNEVEKVRRSQPGPSSPKK